jgi:hypothetical protein
VCEPRLRQPPESLRPPFSGFSALPFQFFEVSEFQLFPAPGFLLLSGAQENIF